MPTDSIDSDRLEAELAADADVIRALRAQGDKPNIVRAVDVRFTGMPAHIQVLRDNAAMRGWTVIQGVELDGDRLALDVQREQMTDDASLRQLTLDALSIEMDFNVEYDGWGTLPQVAPEKKGWFRR